MVIKLDEQIEAWELPADHPVDALKEEHELVQQLFDRYLEGGQDSKERKDIGREILMRLDMHMAVEEGVFYPRVREVDAPLVDQCDAEHQAAKELMEQIRGMEDGDVKLRMFRQLADAIESHINTEEKQLFTKLENSDIDLADIGADMQAFEASMIATQTPAWQPGARG
ncbi:MAG: hemerythrin domain-containing protein [Burkholderiales bacterium]|nr:hemerythrin domain-containing protein [Burkholderiales bacterium]